MFCSILNFQGCKRLHIIKIDFLPTYKRSKKDGRLPGYVDRIFYRGNIIEGFSYRSLPINGNDHLPIYGIFNIKI